MLRCDVCGKATGWLASIKGVSHMGCQTMPRFRQIDRGEFKSFDDHAEILLEHDEHCLAVVKGCAMAGVNPQLDEAFVEAASATPGARADGLVKQDAGSLHITDRRISFIGTFNSRTILLSRVVEIRHSNDVLMIVADGGNESASYFILETPRRLEVTAAVIKKLTDLAQSNQRPTVHAEPPRTEGMAFASNY
jgi:hypothetical protein